MQRRDFLTTSLAAGAALATLNLTTKAAGAATKDGATKPAPTPAAPATTPAPVADVFVQPPLPYSLAALAPFLKEEQMSFHYNKHHAGYFKKLNGLVAGKPEAKMSLEDLITKAQGPIYNNAAQAWNHTFFWSCISPDGGGSPKGPIGDAIDRDFGGVDQFKKLFGETAVNLFGSGWAWLAAGKDKKLQVLGLPNADNPLRQGLTPILTLDVWEHAYYIDYRNDRAKFVEEYWSKVNWEFAAHNLASLAKA